MKTEIKRIIREHYELLYANKIIWMNQQIPKDIQIIKTYSRGNRNSQQTCNKQKDCIRNQ